MINFFQPRFIREVVRAAAAILDGPRSGCAPDSFRVEGTLAARNESSRDTEVDGTICRIPARRSIARNAAHSRDSTRKIARLIAPRAGSTQSRQRFVATRDRPGSTRVIRLRGSAVTTVGTQRLLFNYCSASCRLPIMKGDAGALHLFQNICGLGGPDERLWVFIVMVDVIADGLD